MKPSEKSQHRFKNKQVHLWVSFLKHKENNQLWIRLMQSEMPIFPRIPRRIFSLCRQYRGVREWCNHQKRLI